MMLKKFATFFCAAALCVGCSSINKMKSGSTMDKVEGGLEVADEVTDTVGRSMECEKLRDMMVAIDEEYAVGGAVAVNIVGNNGGLMLEGGQGSQTYRLNQYLNQVGRNLGAQSSRPNLEWTFGVLDTDEFNAYSTPGGYVMVSRGLLKQIDNEAQLAGVLGHEIAHVTLRHAVDLYAAIKANQCQVTLATEKGAELAADAAGFTGALDAPGGFLDLNSEGALGILKMLTDLLVDKITTAGFAHEDEYAADAEASQLMLNAGYDPAEFRKFLSKLPPQGSSHPKIEDRQEKLREWEAAKIAENDPFSLKPRSRRLRTIPIKDQLRPVK